MKCAMQVWQTQSLLLLLSSGAHSQILLAPTAHTNDPRYHDGGGGGGGGDDDGIELRIRHEPSASPYAIFPVTALTRAAGLETAHATPFGELLLTDPQNQLTLSPNYIALISCDPSTSNLGPDSIFNTAKSNNASAVVLYSTTAQTCHGSGFGDYQYVYTINTLDNAEKMLAGVGHGRSWAMLVTRQTVDGNNGTSGTAAPSSSNGNSQNNTLGPSPSTAVAMIILYSITGVITALFLCIIITGAIRAHRHPERYGPRNLIGRPRQTRARGLARAMLDSLPVVKVGDRTDQAAKPTEVELENGQHGPVVEHRDESTTDTRPTNETAAAAAAAGETARNGTSRGTDSIASESGIAAAAVTTERNTTAVAEEVSSLGCSICTEDFEVGEDQRVLPCDHRFHPACIDPWLLNVSGTCPLCRIDLRPAEAAEDDEVDGNGNPVARDGLAPPLDNGEGSRGARVRRSIMVGIMGAARPERMSREERVAALRRYRQNAAARMEEQRQVATAGGAQTEEESSRRRRYRDLFRIRTRRTGEPEPVREAPVREAAADASTTTAARPS